MPDVIAIDAKVARAEEHLVRLQRELASYITYEPGLITGYFEADRQDAKRGIREHINFKPLPHELGVTIGDIVHCIRSALDQLAWKLVVTPGNKTTFPIQDKPTSTDQHRRPAQPNISGVAGAYVRAILAELQPWWPNGQIADPGTPLRVLRELSNNDKHRQRTIHGASVAVSTFSTEAARSSTSWSFPRCGRSLTRCGTRSSRG